MACRSEASRMRGAMLAQGKQRYSTFDSQLHFHYCCVALSSVCERHSEANFEYCVDDDGDGNNDFVVIIRMK